MRASAIRLWWPSTTLKVSRPQHRIAAGPEHAGDFTGALVGIVFCHLRQRDARPLAADAFIAKGQLVEHAPELRIEEHQRRAAVRQRLQQRQRIAVLGNSRI